MSPVEQQQEEKEEQEEQSEYEEDVPVGGCRCDKCWTNGDENRVGRVAVAVGSQTRVDALLAHLYVHQLIRRIERVRRSIDLQNTTIITITITNNNNNNNNNSETLDSVSNVRLLVFGYFSSISEIYSGTCQENYFYRLRRTKG